MLLKALLTTGIMVTMLGSVGMGTSAQAQGATEAEMIGFHQLCEKGDRRACVRFGILIGENRQRHADWRRLHADWWWWEK